MQHNTTEGTGKETSFGLTPPKQEREDSTPVLEC